MPSDDICANLLGDGSIKPCHAYVSAYGRRPGPTCPHPGGGKVGPGFRRDCDYCTWFDNEESQEDTMTQAARFRELLRRDGMVVAPGAYDCITARLIERAGFDAVYMTGAGTAATLGY